ncbi:hypothetical protein CERZMDRAFT_96131 [Cercospora zeae-maydis SCOH1-5]|uniref:Uncharacterized protein n=1 Tax=Cercospora zeae-maydis SCOH1-5 TaxID=717836 RepID=A0A6A6FL52_9PEZI|nr:hypothetical protein CERZMDRAFT_96131 [Cercospora zeae-maydis SCOH1-5]
MDASGEITAEAGVSFPVAIGIGVTIPLLERKGEFKVQLVEQPGVNARAKYKTSTSAGPVPGEEEEEEEEEEEAEEEKEEEKEEEEQPEEGQAKKSRRDLVVSRAEEGDCNNGIDWDVRFIHRVYVEAIFATYNTDYELHKLERQLARGCYKIGGLKEAHDESWEEQDFKTVNEIDTEFHAVENAGDIKLLDEAIDAVEAARLDYKDHGEDVNFIMIQDGSKQFQILQDKTGYLQPGLATSSPVPGSIWAEHEGMVWADYLHRELKFDSKSMQANGWSNIQLGPAGEASSDAESILLVPARTGVHANPSIYLAEDFKGNAYVLLTCGYTTGGSRIFLARNPSMAAKTLKLANSRVAGGKINGCAAQKWIVNAEDVPTDSNDQSSNTGHGLHLKCPVELPLESPTLKPPPAVPLAAPLLVVLALVVSSSSPPNVEVLLADAEVAEVSGAGSVAEETELEEDGDDPPPPVESSSSPSSSGQSLPKQMQGFSVDAVASESQ